VYAAIAATMRMVNIMMHRVLSERAAELDAPTAAA
jgi:hypothetical protein